MAPLPPCLFASHWNGKKWQRLAVPPGIPVGDNPDAGNGIVAAIPGGRAWVFVYLGNNESGTSEVDAVEWTGTSWSAVHHFAGGPYGPIASGPDDVWGFESGNGTAWADHYNGKRWSQVPIPVIAWQASGSAAAGEWVTGRVAAGGLVMYHYSRLHWTHVLVRFRSGFFWTEVHGSMELIPGTRSVLAPAALFGPRNNGAILKYGP